jgi:hypothetical protein
MALVAGWELGRRLGYLALVRVRLLWLWFRGPLIPSFGYLSENFRQDLATLRSEFSSRTTLNSHLDHVSQRDKINNKTINYFKP